MVAEKSIMANCWEQSMTKRKLGVGAQMEASREDRIGFLHGRVDVPFLAAARLQCRARVGAVLPAGARPAILLSEPVNCVALHSFSALIVVSDTDTVTHNPRRVGTAAHRLATDCCVTTTASWLVA
ncbi:hypothetical protein J6590_058356 [Homalodisca vitripennis]|nr:hypothetical protein J6590_058356 [Homalodisca vitripennis]